MASQAAENQNQYKLKVKINNNDDTRLWRYSSADDFEGLCSFITRTWNNDDFIAQYEDDEGDLITIASSQDLKDAFDFARSESKKSLKLYIQNYVKQKRLNQAKNDKNETKEEPESEPAPKEAPTKQFNSVREMVFDFLSNQQIITLLPEFFASFISKLVKKGNNLKPEEIARMIDTEINVDQFNIITSHPLYTKYGQLAIPYIANKIAFQQSLYPHFRVDTIKNWINQLIAMLAQVLQQTAASEKGGCAFKDIVIDIEYPAMTDTGKVIHFGVECDLCGQYPIIGHRYKCSICADWDCCAQCEPKHDHPLIKFKKSSKNVENASFKGLNEIIKRLSGDDKKENDDVEVDIYDDMVVDCICGAKMECVQANKAYKGRCNTVYCDICSQQSFNEMVYHCPNGHDAVHHKNGYDLCPKCADKKVLDDKEKEKEQEQEMEMEQVPDDDEVVVVEQEQEEEEEEEFEFASQLTQIQQIMALESGDNDDLIKSMLVEHQGDISKVVPLLLQ